jgi:hypothetical protein
MVINSPDYVYDPDLALQYGQTTSQQALGTMAIWLLVGMGTLWMLHRMHYI